MILKGSLFLFGILILLAAEIGRVYFIMPFPGSQDGGTIDLAYFLSQHILWFRIGGALLIAFPAYSFITSGNTKTKVTIAVLILLWLAVIYLFNFRFQADKMFYQPESKILVKASINKIPSKNLVLGVFINDEAKAYPIEIIGYHHQVRDTVGNVPVMVTYCTVCRTGRVYKPEVDGKTEYFRLVGMDHFNAMFEDKTTKSWWRQASGEAVVGARKGSALPEIPSEQMTLESWLKRHPQSLILQPDIKFKDEYNELKDFDEGKKESSLEGRDTLSWQKKSWVVGVASGLYAKAYDWNDLNKYRVINDEVGGIPIVVVVEGDSASFHVWNRIVDGDTLHFAYSDSLKNMIDTKTNSRWGWDGRNSEKKFTLKSLTAVQSYQEFWHSWKTFHPNTMQYEVEDEK